MPETVTIATDTIEDVLVTIGAVSTFLGLIGGTETDLNLQLDEAWGKLFSALGDTSDERMEALSDRDEALARGWLLEAAHRGKGAPTNA